jgi:glutathionylspermidine amidase/synthetase
MKLLIFTLLGAILLYNIKKPTKNRIPYNVPIGISNNVTSYSNYNNNIITNNYVNNNYTGEKWQCVEFARRYLIINYHITFDSVENAYNIFDLSYFISLKNNMKISITKCINSSTIRPHIGSLLIWNRNYKNTGHVAIITNIYDDYIMIAEQNYNDISWNGNSYSRKLKLVVDNGRYYIMSKNILGWINYL